MNQRGYANQGPGEFPALLNREIPRYHTDRNFRQALTQPFSASWSNVGIRAIIQRIRETQNISVILDRRVDPSRKLKIDLQNLTLEEGLAKIAELVQARIIIVGSNIFIGPDASVSKLKTLLELESGALRELAVSQKELHSRVLQLSRNQTFHFQDLDTPAEILQYITNAYQITVEKEQLVPHDLWSNFSLVSVNATESLSLILIQFDLTYEWSGDAASIRLKSVPDKVLIKKTYPLRGKSIDSVTRQLKEQFPDLKLTLNGKLLSIEAAMDVHDQIEQLLNPQKAARSVRSGVGDTVPLNRRKFTLRVKKVPVLAIMQKLEQSGIEFEYNKQELIEAKINLLQLIDVAVVDADAEEFFDALFSSFKLDYKMQGVKISLTPQK
ncbi:hypothetical protein [Gimesia algae]|uniref:hypothetical protein n=1 Tax=Gimesia algae TaxID=2527971 RepID=UPI0011A9A372|nr:hypothetical protein [Gimesia algae]